MITGIAIGFFLIGIVVGVAVTLGVLAFVAHWVGERADRAEAYE